MAICQLPAEQEMVSGVIETVDCHIRLIVHDAYRELVGPNTPFAAAFTGLLTIYIALLGYQLLFGRSGLRVTELPVVVLKIGLILAFLTSWAAYQTVIFNLLFEGPEDIMKALMAPLSERGARFDGDVMNGVQRAFEDLSGAAGIYGAMASPTANLLQGGPMLGSGLLWLTAIALLLLTLGLVIAAKIVLAFLLAIGPVFIGMLLFEQTRGLFEGWIRASLSAAMAPLAVNIFGAVMLMILQPFLDSLVANAGEGLFEMGPVITIAIVVIVFMMVMVFGLGAAGAIGRGFAFRTTAESPGAPRQAMAGERAPGDAGGARAEQIVALIARSDRRYQADHAAGAGLAEPASRRSAGLAEAVAAGPEPPADRLGQAYRRLPQVADRAQDG